MTNQSPRRGRPRKNIQPIDGDWGEVPELDGHLSFKSPLRDPIREPIKVDDPLARALERSKEIFSHGNFEIQQDEDAFRTPAPPEGWAYNWKMHSVTGKDFPDRQVKAIQGGWTPVPASRHPELMPPGYMGDHINKEGLVLYERPKQVDDHIRQREQNVARNLVRGKEIQMGYTPPGHAPRQAPQIKRSYEPMSVTEEMQIPFDSPSPFV